MSLPNLAFGDSAKKNVDTLNKLINTTNVTGENLLINPNFKLNSWGETQYCDGSSILTHSVDAWAFNKYHQDTLDVLDNGIKLTSMSDESAPFIRQEIPTEKIVGHTITVSMKLGNFTTSGSTTAPGYIEFQTSTGLATGINKILSDISQGDIVTATFDIPIDADVKYIIFSAYWSCSLEIEWVKLELGEFSTNFIVPNPETELEKVHQYYGKNPLREGWYDSSNTKMTLKDILTNPKYPHPYNIRINSSTAPEGDTSGLYIPDIGLHGTTTDNIWWDIHYYPDTINKTNSTLIAYSGEGVRVKNGDGEWRNCDQVNENLLDNPDFKINQRGKSEYTNDNDGILTSLYTVDRWFVPTISSIEAPIVAIATKVDILDNGIKVSSTEDSTVAAIKQHIGSCDQLKGNYVTLTLSISEVNSTANRAHVCYIDSSGNHCALYISSKTTPGIYYASGYIPEQVTDVYVELYGSDMRNSSTTGEEIGNYTVFNWVKLEVGTVPTVFAHPNPVEELLKIQSINDDGSLKVVSNAMQPTVMNSQMVINPNLLDNPDFVINQRGQSEYTTTGYTVDRWVSQSRFTITPLEGGGIRITPATTITNNLHGLYQDIPVSGTMLGKDYTLTSNVTVTNGYAHMQLTAYDSSSSVVKVSSKIHLLSGINSVTISSIPSTATKVRARIIIDSGAQAENITELSWIKLEMGGVATPFCAPDPASEIIKCQRYYYRFKHQNPTEDNNVCSIGCAVSYRGSVFTAIAVLPVPTMRSGVNATVGYNGIVLEETTSGTEIPITAITALEQTDSTVQLVLTSELVESINGPSGSDNSSIYRVKLKGSDAYLSLEKDLS